MEKGILRNYLSEEAFGFVQRWLDGFRVIILVKSPRKRKLGDYRFSRAENTHQITINNSLPTDLFWLTLTHEIAHLKAFAAYKNILPHGKEWKAIFGKMIQDSLLCYSDEFRPIALRFSQNPKATYSTHDILGNFFTEPNDNITLHDIPMLSKFIFGKRTFKKMSKQKIRYLCQDVNNGRLYAISGRAEVVELID